MEQYLNARQAYEMTGTPEATWRYWAHIGRGPASIKLGRRRVWKRSAIEEWIAEQERAEQDRRTGVA